MLVGVTLLQLVPPYLHLPSPGADFMKHARWNKTFLRKSRKGREPAEPARTGIPTVCGTGATAAAGRETSQGPGARPRD